MAVDPVHCSGSEGRNAAPAQEGGEEGQKAERNHYRLRNPRHTHHMMIGEVGLEVGHSCGRRDEEEAQEAGHSFRREVVQAVVHSFRSLREEAQEEHRSRPVEGRSAQLDRDTSSGSPEVEEDHQEVGRRTDYSLVRRNLVPGMESPCLAAHSCWADRGVSGCG